MAHNYNFGKRISSAAGAKVTCPLTLGSSLRDFQSYFVLLFPLTSPFFCFHLLHYPFILSFKGSKSLLILFVYFSFYFYSAKPSAARNCQLAKASCPSIHLSISNVEVSWSYRLESLENNSQPIRLTFSLSADPKRWIYSKGNTRKF